MLDSAVRVRPLRPRRRVPRGAVSALTIGLAIGLTVAPPALIRSSPLKARSTRPSPRWPPPPALCHQIEGAYAAASRRLSDLRTEAGLAAAAEQAAQALLRSGPRRSPTQRPPPSRPPPKSAADRDFGHRGPDLPGTGLHVRGGRPWPPVARRTWPTAVPRWPSSVTSVSGHSSRATAGAPTGRPRREGR